MLIICPDMFLLILTLIVDGVTTTENSGCEEGWDRRVGYCYKAFQAPVDWYTAFENCKSIHAELVTMRNEEEKQYTLEKTKNSPWLGLHSNHHQWTTWTDGRVLDPQVWGPNQPSDKLPTSCGVYYPLYKGFVWDANCKTLLPYICRTASVIPTLEPPTTPPHRNDGCQDPTTLTPLEHIILNSHNEKRLLHINTDNLCYSSYLQSEALTYALKLSEKGGLEHSDSIFGENLFATIYHMSMSMDRYYQIAVNKWYAEIKHYDFSNPHSGSAYGHFTQLIWSDSFNVGCSHALGLNHSGKKRIIIVCYYNPRGNDHGYYKDNVHQLIENSD